MQRKATAVLVTVLLLTATAGIGAVSAQQSTAYTGANVEFDAENDAVVDYTVGGETVIESLRMQSKSEARSAGSVEAGVGLSSVTSVGGSALSVDSTTETRASVTAESGATLTAHDNPRGILVVSSGGESQYVTADLPGSTRAEAEGDGRVVVTTDDGTEGTFLVVGDGEVTVNDEGGVTAELGEDGTLVFRSYPDGRSDEDGEQERLISEGTAAAEVYVMSAGESGNGLATDVVTYGRDTTVEVTERSEGTVRMTAERSEERGKVVIASVSEGAMRSTDDVRVTVDGEAAAEASSYGELESATDGGESSKFLVRQASSVSGGADVLVAVNHFSTREVTVTDGTTTDGDGTTTDGDDANTDGDGNGGGGESTDTTAPGLGVTVAVVALMCASLLAHVRAE